MPANSGPSVVQASGGIVIDSTERILFIFKDGQWDLPKGIVEKGDSPPATALAEVFEETGTPIESLKIHHKLIPTHHISKYRKVRYVKRTIWHIIKCSQPSDQFKPQTEEGITHCEWIPLWELDKVFANCPERVAYLLNYWLKFRKHFD